MRAIRGHVPIAQTFENGSSACEFYVAWCCCAGGDAQSGTVASSLENHGLCGRCKVSLSWPQVGGVWTESHLFSKSARDMAQLQA